jgi:nucleoside-diphosphate-sugar epimerase
VLASKRRIVVVGAGGWVGRTTIALLREALGEAGFAARVRCFGSADGVIDMGKDGLVTQRKLACLTDLAKEPTLLLHLAFLTKDKVAEMDPAAYAAANRTLAEQVFEALDGIGVDRLFVASSGAAAFADDLAAAEDLRLYGQLKREDETRFAKWAQAMRDQRRAVIARIYSLSGPWINKPETYALASFIRDAQAGRPIEVRAPMAVYRSYVAAREVVSVALAALLTREGDPVLRFDTGGVPLELGAVAQVVAEVVGGQVNRAPIVEGRDGCYVGDDRQWIELLERFGMTSAPIAEQVAETAAWLAQEAGLAKVGI